MSIKTPLDVSYQIQAIKSLRRGIEAYDRRHGWRGPVTNKFNDENWQEKIKRLKIDPTLNWEIVEITNLDENGINFKSDRVIQGMIDADRLKWAVPRKKKNI